MSDSDDIEQEDPGPEEAGPAAVAAAAPDEIRSRARQSAYGSIDGFLAFGFGSGLSARAPGTMGTLASIPLAALVTWLDISQFWFIGLSFAVGVWVCHRVTRTLGVEDYGGIVWDEMVGYWLVVAFVPFQWAWWLGAFVLFRVFDILKPWPISLLDEQLDGGLGIMADDALAAGYAILVLSFIQQMLAA